MAFRGQWGCGGRDPHQGCRQERLNRGDIYCGQRNPTEPGDALIGWVCTLRRGHTGDHVAHAGPTGSTVLARWSPDGSYVDEEPEVTPW